jgi:hypothetical protein
MVGILNSAPACMPVRQREVTAFCRYKSARSLFGDYRLLPAAEAVDAIGTGIGTLTPPSRR